MTDSLRTLLATLVPPGSILSEGEAEGWRTGSGSEGVPDAVVAPAREEELARLLERAAEEGWRVLPAGLGTWLEGGGPSEVRLVVSTRRMREVVDYEPADLTFTAGAGLRVSALRRETERHGQWLPLDPPGGLEGSLGALTALGTSGSLSHLYGRARDHVLGVTLVSGDGRVLRWGGRVVKNVAGFDVTRLAVGSWGCLGVLTSVSARLFPLPEGDVTLCIPGPTVESLLPCARSLALSPLPLAAVDLFDPLPGRGIEVDESFGGPCLVVRLMGSRDEVREMEGEARAYGDGEILGGEGGRRGGGVPGGRSRERLEGKESRALHEKLNAWEDGKALVARLRGLPSELGGLLEETGGLRELCGKGAPLHLAAHVGSGVLRLAVPRIPREGEGLEEWSARLQRLRNRLEEKGGSLFLSRGPDALMREVGAWGAPGAEKRLLEGIKAEFDPAGILAPGRLGL